MYYANIYLSYHFRAKLISIECNSFSLGTGFARLLTLLSRKDPMQAVKLVNGILVPERKQIS